MTVAATVRFMSPEEIASRAGGQTPFLHLPQRTTLFAERSMRLRQLAAGHPMQDYLRFMADLAQQQQAALVEFPSVPLPDAQAIDRAARGGMPPLPAADWPRDAAWRAALRRIVAALRATAPQAAHEVLDRVASADDTWLERQADALLTNVMHGVDLGAAPLVAAALQTYWTHMLLELQRTQDAGGSPIGRIDDAGICPACGSRPTASITRTAGDAQGVRYLHCSLCSLQWHRVRIACVHCGGEKHIAYQSLAGADASGDDATGRGAQAAVQAETCDDCRHYLKIVHTDRDPFVDPVADDLASVTLDLLVAETGMERHGVNLLLLFGEPEPPPSPGDT